MLRAPQNLQSHNRYSYALNNPLSYTDPSGFFNIGKFFKKVFKGIGSFLKGLSKFVFSRQGLAILVSVALMAATGGLASLGVAALQGMNLGSLALSGAIAGAAGGAISTGSLKGAIFGAVSGAIAGYIGEAGIGNLSGFELDAARGGILGFTEGAIAEAQGGDFRTGFFSAAFASIAGAQAGKLLPANDIAAQLIGRSVVGGTASVIGGGKFANGAYSAAFNYVVEKGAEGVAVSSAIPPLPSAASGSTAIPADGGWGWDVEGIIVGLGKIARGLVWGLVLALSGDTPQNRVYMNHYTTEEGMAAILDQKMINPSIRESNPRDARYGDGQYFTNILPGEMTQAQLSRALVGNPFQGSKFTHYITIDLTGIKLIQGRPRIYLVPNPGPLDVSGRIVGYGRN